jgi:hypothetical protein
VQFAPSASHCSTVLACDPYSPSAEMYPTVVVTVVPVTFPLASRWYSLTTLMVLLAPLG